MENATKALLIAGSILIAILLIAMCMKVLNSNKDTIEQVEGTMQTTEVATFNSKFTVYVGTQKSKAQVMSLLNVVIANNATNAINTVKINNSDAVAAKMNNLTEGQYTIKIEGTDYNASTGYIANIRILNSSGAAI